jgi:hypothetical protein
MQGPQLFWERRIEVHKSHDILQIIKRLVLPHFENVVNVFPVPYRLLILRNSGLQRPSPLDDASCPAVAALCLPYADSYLIRVNGGRLHILARQATPLPQRVS